MKKEILRLEHINCEGIIEDFRLSIYEGEIHVLTGLVDSGLMSVGNFLGGTIKAESGLAWFEEKPVDLDWFGRPNTNSVFRFSEECSLVKNMTVAENIFVLNRIMSPLGLVDMDGIYHQTREILQRFKLDISPDTLVENLHTEQQRIVELLKAVALGARLIILEDAWGSYPKWARKSLFGVIETLSKKRVSFLIITQRHEDSSIIMDRITIMNGGRIVTTLLHSEYQESYIHRALLGQDFYYSQEAYGRGVLSMPQPKEIFRVDGLEGQFLDDISFTACSGRIFGLFENRDHGIREFIETLFFEKKHGGNYYIEGEVITSGKRSELLKKGIGLIAYRDGSMLQDNMTWPENLAIALRPKEDRRKLVLSRRMISMITTAFEGEMEGMDPNVSIAKAGISDYMRLKLTYLKVMLLAPKVMVCVKPCSFGDVVMREIAATMIHQAAARGICVIVVSTDPKEVGVCCHDIGIIRNGRLSEIKDQQSFIRSFNISVQN